MDGMNRGANRTGPALSGDLLNLVANDCQSLDGGRITQVMKLLQEQNAKDDVQILRGAPEAIVKVRQQFIDRKIIKKVLPNTTAQEQSSSRLPQVRQLRGGFW